MQEEALRTLIVDDEPAARRLLAEELGEIGGVRVVGEAENGLAALAALERLAPDLVLLDIQMPAMDGFEVLRRLEGPLPAIIFVTAYSEHALRAFEVGAADYLLKPIGEERLRAAIERVRNARRGGLERAERVARAVNLEAPVQRRKIVARRAQDYFLLDLDEIFAFQADGEIVWILTADKKFQATHTLQAIDERLRGAQFQRIHRGVVVNTNKIRKMSALSSQRWLLTMLNGLEFTVSKRLAPLVRDFLR